MKCVNCLFVFFILFFGFKEFLGLLIRTIGICLLYLFVFHLFKSGLSTLSDRICFRQCRQFVGLGYMMLFASFFC